MTTHNTDIKEISKRLKDLRTFSDYSIAEMSKLVGIEEIEYAEYESGKVEVPINVIYKCASLLEIDPIYILRGDTATTDTVSVVPSGQGVKVQRYEGYAFENLAPDFKGNTMNPMMVTIAPTNSPELVVHGGQEFNYCIEGELRVIVGLKEYYLRPGDSIYFNPSLPHAQLAMNNQPAKFLTVINE